MKIYSNWINQHSSNFDAIKSKDSKDWMNYEKIWKKKITTKELGEIGKRTEKLKAEQSNEIWE